MGLSVLLIDRNWSWLVIIPVLIFLGLACPINCAAETVEPKVSTSGATIDSVEIVAEDVFDLENPGYDNFLFRLANKMHIVTRHSVIRRELLLGKGDRFDTALVSESIRNLRRLPYLLKTDIRLDQGQNSKNIMVVNTSDKWTTVGGLSLHRTGGRNDFQIGIEENNLLGYGIFLSNDFMVLEDDRNYYQAEVADKRFLGSEIAMSLFYSDNPRAGQRSVLVSHPYYSLDQKLGGEFNYSTLKRRLDYYVAEDLVARDRFIKRALKSQISYRIGSCHTKYHFTARYEYTDLDARGMYILDPAAIPLLPPPSRDSLIHYFQSTIGVQQIKYRVFERLNRFHKSEDVNLGLDARISYGWAYGSGFDEFLYQYFSYWPQYTTAFNDNLIIMGFQHQEWYTGEVCLNRRLNLYLKAYSQYHNNQTLAIGIRYLSNRLTNQSNTLYLDEDNGLRGYPAFIFNGEDRLVINIENRFFSDLEILTVGIGGVVFADIGNIWARDRDPIIENMHTAFGAGLRFGVSRSTQGEVIRVDFAYAPKRESWQISIGTGQFF